MPEIPATKLPFFLREILCLIFLTTSYAGAYDATWKSLDTRPAPAWYADAKFGIFIHWGVYSVPAWGASEDYAEWYWHRLHATDSERHRKLQAIYEAHHHRVWGADFEYTDFAPLFTADHFDAAQWAELFARSGARYIVPTSKHHEGYCLWPSVEADRTWGHPWNSATVGPERDLMGELSTACRDAGLRFGFYYSLYEWFNPLWLEDRDQYVEAHLFPQFKDVVTRYEPAIIFSDGEWDMPSADWRSPELLAWLFNESPSREEVVVNDRWGKESRHQHGTYYTTEYGAGLPNATHPWEESRGMGHSYGYNRAEGIDDYKSARELILILVDLVSRGGNFLLDIGPTSDGRIPVIMQDRLVQIGDWLAVNGDAIYATRPADRDCQWSEGTRPDQEYGQYKVAYNPMDRIGQNPRDGRAVKQAFFTQNSDTLFAITPGWPGAHLTLRDIELPEGATIRLLGYDGDLPYTREGTTLTIELPNLEESQRPCQFAYAFTLPGARIASTTR